MTFTVGSPALVAVSTVAALGSTPFAEKFVANLDLPIVKLLNLALYGLSFYTASQPGRIDGRQNSDDQSDEKTQDGDDPDIQDYTRRNSLFAPSGWAFAIWALIFSGELVFVTSSALLVKDDSPITPLYKAVSGSFMMAQICQTLWTQAFRPEYKGGLIYISSILLSGIAIALNQAHAQFSAVPSVLKKYQYLLYFFPMTLHFGWTTAASLVNWNGNIAMPKNASPVVVAYTGHVSALLATGLGATLTLIRRAPVFGGVIAWALAACSTGMHERLQGLGKDEDGSDSLDKPVVGVYGARLQKWLCGIGAAISAAASVYVILTPTSSGAD